MDELRKSLKHNRELISLGERLSSILNTADSSLLLEALETGNMDLAVKLLGLTPQELQRLFDNFKTYATELKKQYPDLANFVRAMNLTGSL